MARAAKKAGLALEGVEEDVEEGACADCEAGSCCCCWAVVVEAPPRSFAVACIIEFYPRATVHNSMFRDRGGTRPRRTQKGSRVARGRMNGQRISVRSTGQIAALVFVVVHDGVGGWRC